MSTRQETMYQKLNRHCGHDIDIVGRGDADVMDLHCFTCGDEVIVAEQEQEED